MSMEYPELKRHGAITPRADKSLKDVGTSESFRRPPLRTPSGVSGKPPAVQGTQRTKAPLQAASAQPSPSRPAADSPASDVSQMKLDFSPNSLLNSIILSEVLGRPKALRRGR